MFKKLLLIIMVTLPAAPAIANDALLPKCRQEVGLFCYWDMMTLRRNSLHGEELTTLIKAWPKKQLYALALTNGYLCGYETWDCEKQGISGR